MIIIFSLSLFIFSMNLWVGGSTASSPNSWPHVKVYSDLLNPFKSLVPKMPQPDHVNFPMGIE